MKIKFVELVHEELGRCKVVASAAHVWLARGWRRHEEVATEAELPFVRPENSADEADPQSAE